MQNKLFGVSSKNFLWTNHARHKMNYYQLSEFRIRRVLNSPKRIEKGIALNTIAVMQPSSIKHFKTDKIKNSNDLKSEKWSQEIWVMFQDLKDKRIIISAWRFPGMSKPRDIVSMAKIREEYNSFIKSNNLDKLRDN